MREKIILTAMLLAALAGFNVSAQGNGLWDSSFSGNMEQVLKNVDPQPLSEAEKEGILRMREEEKLARDVYITMYEKWNIRTFTTISKAEQTHMDAMKLLIDRYSLEDPVKTDKAGVFTDPKLRKIYNDLVAQGSVSMEAAVKVGSMVEELDIYDLERLMKESDNNDILIAYQNLLKGSRNHLRAFDRQLKRNGASYTAQFLSQKEYDSIAASNQERGTVITDPHFKY